MGVLQWVLDTHGRGSTWWVPGSVSPSLCNVALPSPARLCSLLPGCAHWSGGIYSARASGILTDEATARLLHCLNHSMQISPTGCSTAATAWGFPGGQRCPSVWL